MLHHAQHAHGILHHTHPVIISKPIKSVSHSSSLSALANDDDAGDMVGLGFCFSVATDGAASLATCGSLPLAVARLSLSGASAANAIGESTLDFRRAPFANVLDSKMISRKFIDFGNIFAILFYKRGNDKKKGINEYVMYT